MGLIKTFTVCASVAGALAWANWDKVENFILESPPVGTDWDNFTTPEPKYPPAETSQINRQSWGYGSVAKDITGNAPKNQLSSVIYESRISVYMNNPAYDAVGQIAVSMREFDQATGQFMGGIENFLCTAQFSETDTYQNLDGADMILSAGHCFEDTDPETGITYKAVGAKFMTDYVDLHGQLQKFESELRFDTLWYMTPDQSQDVAIALLKTPMPDNIKPALALVDYEFQEGQLISSAGFSSDVQGLHEDRDCRVIEVFYNGISNTCDRAPGLSGAGTEISSDNLSLTIGSIASSHSPGGSNLSQDSLITSFFLDQVPFLERVGGSFEGQPAPVSQQYSCLLVTTERLNIRDGRGTDFNLIAKAEYGAQFVELDRVGNWSRIQLPDTNRLAYVHNGHVQRLPC